MDATRFVEEVLSLGVTSRQQIDEAARLPSSWRTLPARLVERGADRGDILSAVSSTVGLPPVPPSVLRTASYESRTLVAVDVWRGMLACPLGTADGIVLLTTSLDAVTQAQALGVTPARVFVALEQDVEDMLRRAENPSGGDDVRPPPAGTTATFEAPPNTTPATPDTRSGPISALSDQSGDDVLLEHAAGQRLCGYDIYEELGRGGSAVVFRARRPGEREDVALKIITKETARDPAFPQRFKREIRAQASLTHPNIVHVVDYGREQGWYYLATEYLPGGTLEELVARSGPLPGVVAVLVLDEVLRGIAFAQTRGVVHRDLKPGNLLLAPGGRIKIGDFGLARMDLDPNKSSFGTVQGTPAYMSPEQALGLDIDGRSDLFTLATIVFEAVVGTNPYRREIGPATLMAVAQARSLHLFDVSPAVPLELDDVVYQMSHKDLERRPASAEDVLAALAPATQRITRRWPGLLESYLHAPVETRQRLTAELAAAEVACAREAIESDEKLRPRAALAVVRALAHEPQHAAALALWDALSETFRRGGAERPELVDVEQRLADTPDDPRLVRRASELARGEGNVQKQAAYLRRFLRLGQKDSLALHQLSLLLPDEPGTPPAAREAGRIATPLTSPVAAAPSVAAPPSTSQGAAAPSTPPTAPPAAIPSERAPRVVGTGAESGSHDRRSGRGLLVATVVVVTAGLLAAAAWLLG